MRDAEDKPQCTGQQLGVKESSTDKVLRGMEITPTVGAYHQKTFWRASAGAKDFKFKI
jgi:hypothetical protein